MLCYVSDLLNKNQYIGLFWKNIIYLKNK